MKKAASRFIVLLSVLAILIVNLAVPVSAADLSAAQTRSQITTIYQRCLSSRGSSFKGYCGDYVGWQLYHLGIITSHVSFAGKDNFDYYNNYTTTSGGYSITSYPAQRYTLKSALNAISNNGTKNVYNILVGLEKGNTYDAQSAGHAVFIHAIIDGMVYFSESGNLDCKSNGYYTEGTPICFSIDYVCDYIWMYVNPNTPSYVPKFDGVIHFQGGGSTSVPDKLTISGLNYPITKASGGYFSVYGSVSSPYPITQAEAIVYDVNGNVKFSGACIPNGSYYFNLNSIDSKMRFSSLPDGTYKYFVQAKDEKDYYAFYETYFTVGGSTSTSGTVTVPGFHNCTDATWGTGVVKTAPTCMSTGVRVYTCSVCNATKEETIPKKTTHTYGEWKTVTPATINAAGESRRYCTVNGCTAYESKVLPQLEHTHDFTGREEIVTPASCTAEGSKKVYCTNSECGEYTLVTLPKTGHTAGEWQVDGNKKVKKCTECGTVVDTLKRLPGDVDDDGKITVTDCLYSKRYILGTFSGNINLENADVDGNGRIDATDYLYLKRGYLGTFDLSKFA